MFRHYAGTASRNPLYRIAHPLRRSSCGGIAGQGSCAPLPHREVPTVCHWNSSALRQNTSAERSIVNRRAAARGTMVKLSVTMSTSTTRNGWTDCEGVLRNHPLPERQASHHAHHAGKDRRQGGCYLRTACTLLLMAANAAGQPSTVPLGTASPYAVLAGSTITNTGSSVVSGDVGLSPGTEVTGFPPGTVTGAVRTAAAAAPAQSGLVTAYLDAAGRTPATVDAQLGGQTLVPGVYHSAPGTFDITGTLTLDGQSTGVPSSSFRLRPHSPLPRALRGIRVVRSSSSAAPTPAMSSGRSAVPRRSEPTLFSRGTSSRSHPSR